MDTQPQLFDRAGVVTPSAHVQTEAQRAQAACVNTPGVQPGFAGWLADNEAIWREFCALADQMRNRGRKYYSARAVIHVLRWHRALREAPDEGFKINNNWSAQMARLYNAIRGVEFFRLRENGDAD